MCTLGIDYHGENNLILAFIHATLYSKTKKAFPLCQNPAKNGLATMLLIITFQNIFNLKDPFSNS